jgi:hypothetical protein
MGCFKFHYLLQAAFRFKEAGRIHVQTEAQGTTYCSLSIYLIFFITLIFLIRRMVKVGVKSQRRQIFGDRGSTTVVCYNHCVVFQMTCYIY